MLLLFCQRTHSNFFIPILEYKEFCVTHFGWFTQLNGGNFFIFHEGRRGRIDWFFFRNVDGVVVWGACLMLILCVVSYKFFTNDILYKVYNPCSFIQYYQSGACHLETFDSNSSKIFHVSGYVTEHCCCAETSQMYEQKSFLRF